MKRIFKLRLNLERNGLWSGRESEFLCYILKPTENNDTVYGFSFCISETSFASARYVKGIMKDNLLLLMQFINTYGILPICYCFPSRVKDGYWSSFNIKNGIFPIFSEAKRADGHAKLFMSEVSYTEKKECYINNIVSSYLKLSDIKLNNTLIREPNNLSDFDDPKYFVDVNL